MDHYNLSNEKIESILQVYENNLIWRHDATANIFYEKYNEVVLKLKEEILKRTLPQQTMEYAYNEYVFNLGENEKELTRFISYIPEKNKYIIERQDGSIIGVDKIEKLTETSLKDYFETLLAVYDIQLLDLKEVIEEKLELEHKYDKQISDFEELLIKLEERQDLCLIDAELLPLPKENATKEERLIERKNNYLKKKLLMKRNNYKKKIDETQRSIKNTIIKGKKNAFEIKRLEKFQEEIENKIRTITSLKKEIQI